MNDQPKPVLLLCRDLMFVGRVIATARSVGVGIVVIRDPEKLTDQAGLKVIADLNQEGAMESAAKWKAQTGGTIIGFVAHVDTASIEKAQGLGFDQVMPRSAFVNRLEGLLAG